MNKYIFYLLFIFSFSQDLLAEVTEETTAIVLEGLNHRGALVTKDVVLIKGPEVRVNGELLGPSEVITQSHAIRTIAHVKSVKIPMRCEGGSFKHTYKKAKIVKVEHGCLLSERYNELAKGFLLLKKDKITE